MRNEDCCQEDILSLMADLELTPNMSSLILESVTDLNATVIIISDSNTEFIGHILSVKKLDQAVEKVFTNPAHWDHQNKLLIQPYHHQVQTNEAMRV